MTEKIPDTRTNEQKWADGQARARRGAAQRAGLVPQLVIDQLGEQYAVKLPTAGKQDTK